MNEVENLGLLTFFVVAEILFFLKQDLKTEGFPKINIKSEIKIILLE